VKNNIVPQGHVLSKFISRNRISRKIKEMGKKISEDYADSSLVMIILTKGALIFAADLMREIKVPMCLELISAYSYKGKNSSGKVTVGTDLRTDIKNKRVLIVDEILDTGKTMSRVIEVVRKMKPSEIRTCVLLDKPARRTEDIKSDYTGFVIPDVFVVGYGLDLNEYCRNLSEIMIAEQ